MTTVLIVVGLILLIVAGAYMLSNPKPADEPLSDYLAGVADSVVTDVKEETHVVLEAVKAEAVETAATVKKTVKRVRKKKTDTTTGA